ncbi:hypothetical protein KY320_03530 [Candidatus Woesearchaeota archaeon]|nr:hypothetical protein [Candidatus Woesearchaeota archaeon]
MSKTLYTSCFGCFVFDASFKLAEKIDFKEVVRVNSQLEKCEWSDEELALIAKHNPEFFLGFKVSKRAGIKVTQDPKKLQAVRDYFKGDIAQFAQTNTLITKQKLKNAVGEDLLIIQCINSIQDINRSISRLAKRLREWYSFYNPEFGEKIDDHEAFIRLILEKSRKELLDEIKVKESESMGADLEKKDVEPMLLIAQNLRELYALKQSEESYLEKMMNANCPNIEAVAGALIGARLMAIAGSLERLAIIPSSTLQLLGAEKALFRHLTKKSLPPKYGILHEHPLISKAKHKDHGKVARALADKISLAAKVDYFKGEFVGDRLKAELEKRFGK